VQKEFMDLAIDAKSMEIQKSIKKLFDPNEILNPGKIF
jgi:glycolate oxidase